MLPTNPAHPFGHLLQYFFCLNRLGKIQLHVILAYLESVLVKGSVYLKQTLAGAVIFLIRYVFTQTLDHELLIAELNIQHVLEIF